MKVTGAISLYLSFLAHKHYDTIQLHSNAQDESAQRAIASYFN